MTALFDTVIAAQSGPASGTSMRRAALLLHGMAGSDRRWIWARLGGPERQALAPLLHELRQMNVRQEECDLDIDHAMARTPPPTPAQGTTELHEVLKTASEERVAAILLAEPVGLVHRLLALGPWPWRDAVLRQLRADRPGELEPNASQPFPHAPALDEALVSRLALRLQGDGQTPAHTAPAAWWRPMRRAVRRLLEGARS